MRKRHFHLLCVGFKSSKCILNFGGKNVIGAVVFIIVFVLILLLSLVGIALPPADWIIQEYIPNILQTDYAALIEGIINGVIYGVIVWVLFTIFKMIYDRTAGPKEIVVKVAETSVAESLPSSARIEEIEGIGPNYVKKLKKVEIKTTNDLLEAGGTKKGRKELSEITGISETIILEWVNMADLFRIRGIGEEYSDLLKEAGVNTVIELSRRNPENLHETMVGVNEAKKRVRRTPTLNQTKDWIEQAKMLPRKVEY
jgi:predicted flap endonuclease-1-like 5' DNA nuclease